MAVSAVSFTVWGLGCGVQGLGAGVWCVTPLCAWWGSRFVGWELGVQVVKSRVWCSGFRVQSSGFGVSGLGFRVQGLGFRVWGLVRYPIV